MGKVFITGLNKSDRKQGLLKTLKNIENKSGNQLIALNNLFNHALKGKNNGNNKGDDDKFNNDYEKIINNYLNKKIKYMDIVDKLNKVNKGIKIYEKNQKLYKNSPNIKDQINNSKKFAKGLEKIIAGIDNNKIRIGKDFITEPGSIDLSWMYDPPLYEEISQDVFSRYNKDKDSLELLSIQSFLDHINYEYIKNKKDALSEFKTVKNNVKNKNLNDIVKELERAIFGYDNEEPEYEESIAEGAKMRRQNNKTNKKDISRTFAPPDPGSDDLDKLTEMYDILLVRLVMTKILKKKQNRQKKYTRKAMIALDMMVLGMASGGLIKMGLIKMGLMMVGLMMVGLIRWV